MILKMTSLKIILVNSTVCVVHFNSSVSEIYKITTQTSSKNIDLNRLLSCLSYNKFVENYTHNNRIHVIFSSTYRTFFMIVHSSGYESNIDKFERVKIIEDTV